MRRGAGCRAYLQVADGEDGIVHLLVPLSHGTLFSLLGMGAYISSCQCLPQLSRFTTPCRICSACCRRFFQPGCSCRAGGPCKNLRLGVEAAELVGILVGSSSHAARFGYAVLAQTREGLWTYALVKQDWWSTARLPQHKFALLTVGCQPRCSESANPALVTALKLSCEWLHLVRTWMPSRACGYQRGSEATEPGHPIRPTI